MFRKVCPSLALSAALTIAADPQSGNPLETIREGAYSRASGFHATARLLNWNIDRGKHRDDILAAIRARQPDLCVFQEVDLGARRTQARDVARDLAEATGMNYAFAAEFRELSQGTPDGAAYHGQATLTSLPIRSSRMLRFTHQSGFWKPNPLMISKLPLFQRRVGGRIALVTELDNGGKPLVVYNLHLESRDGEQLRLEQLNEVLADAERYPAGTPVILAGDLNTKYRNSPVIPRLGEAGYHSCFGGRKIRTHIFIGALDWVFVRGPVECVDAQVHRDLHGSDHFPISALLRF